MKSDFFKIGPVLSVFFLLTFQLYAFEEIKLEGISRVGPPVIIKDRIIYNINIVFNSIAPKEYWLYYDVSKKKLIIDYYDIKINAPPLTIRGTDFLSDPEVWNIESPMSLTGKRAQIRFSMKEGLHYEAALISDTILCLQLWRYLEPSISKRHIKPILIIPSIVTIIAAVIASSIVVSKN